MSTDTREKADCNPPAFNETLKLCELSFLDRQKWRWRANKDPRLGSAAKLVLDCLVMHINCKYEECFPSQELMCAETALSENTIRAALKALRDCGWIDWKRASRPGRQTFFVYRMIWDANPQIEPIGTIYQGPPDPAEIAASAPGEPGAKPSTSGGSIPQELSPNSQREITKISRLSSATPTKDGEQSIEKAAASPSAEPEKPLQEGSADWWRERVWNETGAAFKARFYPTISKAAFKARLGGVLRRQQWDMPTVDRALHMALTAEPAMDAWEYVAGILRRRVSAGPDYSKPLVVRGVM